jgi:5-methylcytosine-specific restriction endonuclease McrA
MDSQAKQQKHRPCERQCRGRCGRYLHYSRFYSRRRITPNGTVWHFDDKCKTCQQIERNERKNADRALAIIEGRASERARDVGKTREFMMTDMNWSQMVAEFRAMMGPDGRCKNCGHKFMNERDIQIDHIFPPRHIGDWAREHARNLRLLCASCNATKQNKDPAEWLDEQEDARIGNAIDRERQPRNEDWRSFLPFDLEVLREFQKDTSR